MGKQIEIIIEKVNGYCSNGYKVGDKIDIDGYLTPNKFCGGAYTMLFPIIVVFNSDGKFNYEKDPYSKTGMTCPDNGNIVFSVNLKYIENKAEWDG